MKTNLYPVLISFFMGLTLNLDAQEKKIRSDLDGNKTQERMTAAPAKTGSAGTFDLKAHNDSLNLLYKKTEELTGMAQKVRADAKGKDGDVKKLLLSEAGNLEKQSQLVQVAASELSSRISNYKFTQNKAAIKNYVSKTGEENVPVYTKNLIFDSEKIMRLAKEMREEANAQPSLASKLGTMGNAEEQESLALSKQVEALTQLERASQGAISSGR